MIFKILLSTTLLFFLVQGQNITSSSNTTSSSANCSIFLSSSSGNNISASFSNFSAWNANLTRYLNNEASLIAFYTNLRNQAPCLKWMLAIQSIINDELEIMSSFLNLFQCVNGAAFTATPPSNATAFAFTNFTDGLEIAFFTERNLVRQLRFLYLGSTNQAVRDVIFTAMTKHMENEKLWSWIFFSQLLPNNGCGNIANIFFDASIPSGIIVSSGNASGNISATSAASATASATASASGSSLASASAASGTASASAAASASATSAGATVGTASVAATAGTAGGSVGATAGTGGVGATVGTAGGGVGATAGTGGVGATVGGGGAGATLGGAGATVGGGGVGATL